MRTNSETVVGVVGAGGDLGRQVASMAAEHGFTLLRADKKRILGGTSLQTILDVSDIVHFAIPGRDFEGEYTSRPDQLRILHDSVMATSEEVNAAHFDGQADIVHMLMNQEAEKSLKSKLLRLINSLRHGFHIHPSDKGSVIVERDSPHLDLVKGHMSSLGLQAIEMSADEHDNVMARSQAPLAILVKLLLGDLREWHQARVLTPSGDALLSALEDRAAKWTDTTMESLLKNPELEGFIADIQRLIADGGRRDDQ